MFPKTIMILSTIILGNIGIILTFMPEEILKLLYLVITKELQLIFQILGAFYFSFAILNWMTKSNLIGGIYGKPVVIANLAHFSIVSIALIKEIIANPNSPTLIWAMTLVYTFFAICFGIIVNRHPVPEISTNIPEKNNQKKKNKHVSSH